MLKTFVKANAFRLTTLTALSMVNAGCIFLVFSLINRIASPRFGIIPSGTIIQAIIVIIGLTGTAIYTQAVAAELGGDFVTALRRDFAFSLLKYPFEPGSTHSTDGLSAFINDIADIAPIAIMAPLFAYNLLFAAAALSYLAYTSPSLTGLVVGQMVLMIILSIKLLRDVEPAMNTNRRTEDELYSVVQSLQRGRKELLTNHQRAHHYHETIVLPSIAAAARDMKNAHARIGFFQAWSSCIFYIIVLVTIIVAKTLVYIDGTKLISFVVGCLLLVGPVNFLLGSVQQVIRGTLAVQRARTFTERNKGSIVFEHNPLEWNEIKFDEVSYTYPFRPALPGTGGYRTDLGPINISIFRGEVIFLVGENGSGKSTLLLLLSCLINPLSGRILIDGTDISSVKDNYIAQISTIFLDNYLFNEVLGKAGSPVSNQDLSEVAAKIFLDGVIETSGARIRNLDLSSGQRRRVALLQMLLEDREILILDEVTSDQDPEFKIFFYNTLLNDLRSRQKTVILATHDAAFFGCADRLLSFQDGIIPNMTSCLGEINKDR